MLMKFEVERFKNFEKKIVFDLSKTSGYEFNDHLIKNNLLRCGVIFGKNASGKSNLGLAIFDLITHLTDKEKVSYTPYINLNSKEKDVVFRYTFKFDSHILEYRYKKDDIKFLLNESLYIDNQEVIHFNHTNNTGYTTLIGSENLNVDLMGNNISFVKYINNNTVLKENSINSVFKQFINFVDNMLLFYSLGSNQYLGYSKGSESIADSIVRKGKLRDFELFLNNLDISCKLKKIEIDGRYSINNVFENGESNFFSSSSIGTRALSLYYYWLINAEDASFIFMDEFDAYYHFELSTQIVKETLNRRKDAQIIFTSHNTNLMTNDLFRPDCLFILQESGLKTMNQLTKKELRYAHNLQKMYRAGAFNE